MEHSHKAGALKQTNKSHKQVKSSKRANKLSMGGRVEKSGHVTMKEKIQNKKDLLNTQRQIRDNKRREQLEKRKAGAGNAFPSAIAIIPLGENVDTCSVLKRILDFSKGSNVRYSDLGQNGIAQPVTIVLPKYKNRLTFLCCTQNLENVLDTCKVADICMFVTNAANGEEAAISPQADLLLTAIRNQGLPASVGFISNLGDIANQKQRANMKKFCTRLLQTELNPTVKIFDEDHLELMLRGLCDLTPSILHWRQMRSYMLGEEVAVLPSQSLEEENSPFCRLCVRGYLRGGPCTVYDFVHITGEGTHQVEYVKVMADPLPVKAVHSGQQAMEEEIVMAEPQRVQELREEEEVDPTQVQEPQWPTPSASLEAKGAIRNTEAIWQEIVGDELYEDEEDRREHMALAQLDEAELSEDEMDFDFDGEDAEDFARREGLGKRRELNPEERVEQEQEYFENPDEVDLDLDQAARYRYIKYRGLQSFRSSPWDPKENLPVDYATIAEFPDFEAIQKAAMDQQESRARADRIWEWENEEGVVADRVFKAGDYVEVCLHGVSRAWIAGHASTLPLLLSWLLPYEEKLTVVHTSVQRSSTWSPAPLKSRDLLVAHMGFRHVMIRPLFFETGIRCDKCKYVKWVQPTGFVGMCCYAPMSYRPTPLTIVKPRSHPNEDMEVVAMGTMKKASTDTVVLKKIVLTGSPFKVRRKLATVRHMFYEPRDILWFKPVELHTRLGLVGHIREPLGTHGYMKCIFNDQLSMNDEVRMALYKRVYPKKVTSEELTSYI